MKHIYIKDADGRKVIVEVTDEVAQAYRESQRKEWRGNAHENVPRISASRVADKHSHAASAAPGCLQGHGRNAQLPIPLPYYNFIGLLR